MKLAHLCTKSYAGLQQMSYDENIVRSPNVLDFKIRSLQEFHIYAASILKLRITFDAAAAFLVQFDVLRSHRSFANKIDLLHYTLDTI